jgi:hypothetical protein
MDKEHLENDHGSFDSIEWLCGLALKRFESADKVFDVLNNRAGLLIGFSGLFSPFVIQALQRLPIQQRQISASILILIFMLTSYFSIRVIQVVEVDIIPLKRETADKYLTQPLEDSKQEFLSNLLAASERNEKVNQRKAMLLRKAVVCIGFQVLVSLAIILFGTI